MRTGILFVSALSITCCLSFSLNAQQETPYILNGTAIAESCNCYRLTIDQNWMAGSVWNKNEIDLTQSFNYIFNVFLGCKDQEGADGIVFVLQPISTSIGTAGQGLGFENVQPSIGIPIDTWQNFDFNDPPFDHIGIYKNGDLVNGTTNTLAGPVPALATSSNIEDCQWHTFRIIWDANAKILSAEVDNVLRVKANIDLVSDIFRNDPKVYWGFSASTGGRNNVQKFCTSLNPSFSIPDNLNTCAPALVPFTDNSTSFGTIVNWWWDFGDGTRFTGQNPPPHAYPAPGDYAVKMNIEANNGCISDTLHRIITIGSIPDARFVNSPPIICANNEALFIDSSFVEFGTINQWNWNFNNGTEQVQMKTPGLRKTFPEGIQQIELVVKTAEGCISEPYVKTLNITVKPSTSISVKNACYGDPVLMNAGNLTPDIPIRQWYWSTGDGEVDSGARINHYYAGGGLYPVGVYALNYTGCSSDTATATVTIYQTRAHTGNDTIVAFGQPLQLNATGGDYYQWIPGDGLNNPNIADPVAVLYNDMRYVVKVYTTFGCPTYDTIQIKAYKGPAFYVPNAFTPDNNGINDHFHPIAVGMGRIDYFEIFNRLGQKIYSSSGNSRGWDGTFDGKPQPLGSYIWIISGQDYQGKLYHEKGTVILIR